MKKAVRIIVISILSLMVTSMGVGVITVHCAHNGDMSLLTLNDVCPDKPCCCHDNSGTAHAERGCRPDSDCMRYDFAKLSPFNVEPQTLVSVFVAHVYVLAEFVVDNAGIFTEKSGWSGLRQADTFTRSSRFRLSSLCVLRL